MTKADLELRLRLIQNVLVWEVLPRLNRLYECSGLEERKVIDSIFQEMDSIDPALRDK